MLVSTICSGADIVYESDAFEVNNIQYFQSDAGEKCKITFHSDTPIRTGSIYNLDDVISQCQSADVEGWDKQDHRKTKHLMGGLKKPKKISIKEKKHKDKMEEEKKK